MVVSGRHLLASPDVVRRASRTRHAEVSDAWVSALVPPPPGDSAWFSDPVSGYLATKIAASPAPSVMARSLPLGAAVPVPSAEVQLVMPLLPRPSAPPETVRFTAPPRLIA